MTFKGSIPAVITPFSKNLDIDFDSLGNHIDFLIENGSHGLVSCGTTGESPTLSHDEHMLVTEFIIKRANSRVPVMAGCGSNSTKESVELSKHAFHSGAKGNLLVTPYYNKPTENGLYEHFKIIAESSPSLPVFLYNIPGRSMLKLSSNLIKKLSEVKNIIGVKDATADLVTPLDILNLCGDKFIQLSGEDATFLAFLISGGSGCISVTANVAPKLCAELYNNWIKQDIKKCMEINSILYPLNKALFIETSPCPVKYALSKMQRCSNNLRLPLVSVKNETKKEIDIILKNMKMIS
jgi:4-hydroxy-tetrahydrodipicolinate synthase|tara:strand:+ start:723 stop:1607 length:885 start_codon:yes stop_codon:yes gene_type:complete